MNHLNARLKESLIEWRLMEEKLPPFGKKVLLAFYDHGWQFEFGRLNENDRIEINGDRYPTDCSYFKYWGIISIHRYNSKANNKSRLKIKRGKKS